MLSLLPHPSRISPSLHRRFPFSSAMHSNYNHHRRHQPPSVSTDDSDRLKNIKQAETYHDRTKHSLTSGYARGPRGLDWANQPNPFLRYVSSPLIPLLHFPSEDDDESISSLYYSIFSSLPSPPHPLNSKPSLSRLLYYSLSLSAWKTTGYSTWSLRVNPSSGNLHPTEAHILSPPIPDISTSPFLSHYSPKDHSLELRAQNLPDIFDGTVLPINSLLVIFSSIFWREAWKYGERALRYCNHDVGHALAAVAIAAASLGWDSRLIDGLGHDELHSLLGLDQAYGPQPSPDQIPDSPVRGRLPWVESQHPDCLLLLFPSNSLDATSVDCDSLAGVSQKLKPLQWLGSPNSLSKDHVCWDIIYKTAEAVKKPLTRGDRLSINPWHSSELISDNLYKRFTVREVVRKRRSAVDMDGVHVVRKETFYQILLHCLPSGIVEAGEKQGKQYAMPFRILPWDAEVHAVLFVHRVADLPKGLYFLVRNEEHYDSLKLAMRTEFEWEKPPGCPDGLPLYRLARGDCQELAKELSCIQDIASDGCFSLGMVARFDPVLREKGAWMYPRLFWETGVLGQVLYLEAHAVGISATGIGCYFDDGVHEVLGLRGSEFQSLYHFTIGSPVLDTRIMSLPAYPGPGVDA